MKKNYLGWAMFLMLLFAMSSNLFAADFIQIQGSDTMVNLGQNFAESYMEHYDDAVISVTGGGSGTGIAALINRTVDIANVSRVISDAEIAQANANNVDPQRIVVAMDGLAVITNESLGINELTVDEIGAIFRGDIVNWSELGGPDLRINLYGRQSNSGTYVYFRENILQADYHDRKRQMNATAQIVEAVMTDRSAIGYVGIAYAVEDGSSRSGITILNIAVDENSPYTSPLIPENIETGLYPIARPLNMYINGEAEGAIKKFFEFVLSSAGQQVAVNIGFYPVSPEFQEFNAQKGF